MLDTRRSAASRAERAREAALAAIEAGPRGVLPVLCGASLFTGVVGNVILLAETKAGHHPVENTVARWLLVVVALAGAVGLVLTRVRTAGSRLRGDRSFPTAAMLALSALLILLLVPVHYLAARTHPSPLRWNSYGFLDKRWLTSLFLLLTLGSAVLLALANRVVETAWLRPASWRAWLRELAPPEPVASTAPAEGAPVARWRGPLLVVLKLAAAVVVATLFFGPPWHLPAAPIDYHETNTMGGLQAIRTGTLPYLDAASVQYGPGAQIANDLYASWSGRFNVEGFRVVTLLFNWGGALLFFAALYLRARLLPAALATFAAITLLPALQFFHVGPHGFVTGFWGWANPLRYAGVFLLAMLFPAAVAVRRAWFARAGGLALGVAWGLLCYVAQENLIGGAITVGVLAILLVATETATRRAVVSSLLWLAGGFLLVWLPVLGYYAANGRLGRFLELYWLVPSAVASGYSNSWWTNPTWGPWFHWLPYLLTALLLAALIGRKPVGLAKRWSKERVVLVGALVAALVSHLGALTRSDTSHLKNTQLALPAALALAILYLPGLLGLRRRWGAALGVALALLIVVLLPSYLTQPEKIGQRVWWPASSHFKNPHRRSVPVAIPPHSQAARRIGDSILPSHWCCARRPISMVHLVRFMDRLHRVVGPRRVYVESVTSKSITPPAVYFLADLKPARNPEDFHTMAFNSELRKEWYAYFERHIGGVQAFVGTDPTTEAAGIWTRAFPAHRTVKLRYGKHDVFVYLR